MGLAADWLRPIYEHIRTGVMAGGYLQIDETPIRYLSPGHGQTKLGYFWTALSPGGDVVYHWETSRGADCLKNVIPADFQGTLQCDAYVAYGSFVKKHQGHITLAGCWAHARRNFYEAREQAPQRCGWILRQIGHLYRIEENLRRSKAGPNKRAAVRMSQSRPICQRLHRALVLFKKSRRYLPRSAFGQAIDYALSNWPLLGVYLEDGRTEIGRVGNRRGDRRIEGVAVVRRLSPQCRCLSLVQSSVSCSRSSNRTCSFPASGSHLGRTHLRFQ
jgi:transposase